MTAINTAKIEAKVAGRKLAESVCELAMSEAATLDDGDSLIEYWLAIRSLALRYVPLPPPEQPKRPAIQPMTKAEADAFENTLMPFGKYAGYSVGYVSDVDPRYLDWLVAQSDSGFKSQLNRYLLADRSITPVDDEEIPF